MSMISSYPSSYSSGPRYRGGDDDEPSLITPYRSGTAEEEEELEVLRRFEQQQLEHQGEAHRQGRPAQAQSRPLEIRGQLSAQDQPPPDERPESEGQDELAGLSEPAMKPSRSERAAWFRDQLESAGMVRPDGDELPALLVQGQEQPQVPRRPRPTVDDIGVMPKSQLLKEAAPGESSVPLPKPESGPQMEENGAVDAPSRHSLPLQPRLDYTPVGPKAKEDTSGDTVPPDLDWAYVLPNQKNKVSGVGGHEPFMTEHGQQSMNVPAASVPQSTVQDRDQREEGPNESRLQQQILQETPKYQAGNSLSTTIRIGDYPDPKEGDDGRKKQSEWNSRFRTTYGHFAVAAAREKGVPARLLAALSANEMAAKNWNALNAFADRNTLLTRSVGPLQISADTALKYKLVPIDNEFYGADQDTTWIALHDPDVRYGTSPMPSALSLAERFKRRNNPYPDNPNGSRIVHDYLDNPATGFQAGAKLLDIYLKKLIDDCKSGAYLNYSRDFKYYTGLSKKDSGIWKDLEILASGDKEAIFNLQCSYGLAKAMAMMWNNDAGIVDVNDIHAKAPNAFNHGVSMYDQQDQQNNLIPDDQDVLP